MASTRRTKGEIQKEIRITYARSKWIQQAEEVQRAREKYNTVTSYADMKNGAANVQREQAEADRLWNEYKAEEGL